MPPRLESEAGLLEGGRTKPPHLRHALRRCPAASPPFVEPVHEALSDLVLLRDAASRRRHWVGGGGRRLELLEQDDTCPARVADGLACRLELRAPRARGSLALEAQPRDRLKM